MKFFDNAFEGDTLTKKHVLDAGLDIKASEDVEIPAYGGRLISTGLFLAIPPGYVGLFWSRSGLSLAGLHVGAGCIDASYRGECKVVLHNLSDKPFQVKKGDRIAQLLTVPVNLGLYEQVPSLEELCNTDRGEGGFGSTGKD